MANEVVKPGDNIFEVLGFEKEEAQNFLIRSQLMGEIKSHIQKEQLSLRKAAILFDTTHVRINDLMQGRIDKFTIDYLVNMLVKAGKQVHVEVHG